MLARAAARAFGALGLPWHARSALGALPGAVAGQDARQEACLRSAAPLRLPSCSPGPEVLLAVTATPV